MSKGKKRDALEAYRRKRDLSRSPEPGGDSAAFARRLLDEAGIVLTPGVGFGSAGEGFCRLALCQEKERLAEAMERLAKL